MVKKYRMFDIVYMLCRWLSGLHALCTWFFQYNKQNGRKGMCAEPVSHIAMLDHSRLSFLAAGSLIAMTDVAFSVVF